MEALIKSITDAIIAVGFERAMLAVIISAVVYHYVVKVKADTKTAASTHSTQMAAALASCPFVSAEQELIMRNALDNHLREMRRDLGVLNDHMVDIKMALHAKDTLQRGAKRLP